MRVAIIGSPEYKHLKVVEEYIKMIPDDVTVVCGGGQGFDQFVEASALECGLAILTIFEDKRSYGNASGIMHKQEIVEAADILAVFWNGKSSGIMNAVIQARQRGLEVSLFNDQQYQ